MTQEELKLDLLRKIKDAPNSYIKRKYLIELQEMKKTKICPYGFHSYKDSECDCGTK